jgi:hypothetical protein
MKAKGVIRKVDEPTDWVNSLVVAEKHKTGKLRVCLDPRNLNLRIKREHFQLPTIEDWADRIPKGIRRKQYPPNGELKVVSSWLSESNRTCQ